MLEMPSPWPSQTSECVGKDRTGIKAWEVLLYSAEGAAAAAQGHRCPLPTSEGPEEGWPRALEGDWFWKQKSGNQFSKKFMEILRGQQAVQGPVWRAGGLPGGQAGWVGPLLPSQVCGVVPSLTGARAGERHVRKGSEPCI